MMTRSNGYMGVLINYITPAWKRVSICVGCAPFDENHTGQNIGEWLDEKMSDWDGKCWTKQQSVYLTQLATC